MKKEIRKVLVVNSGSSSLKYQLFDMKTETRLAKGLVERIGCGGPKDHGEALKEVVKQLEKTVPDAPRVAGSDIATRLKQLDALKAQGLITEAEYAEKRTAILAEL